MECLECGLLYRSPRPRADDVRNAYEEERYAEERLEQLHRSQLTSFRGKARALVRRLGSGARVLEAGSFVGSFLRAAEEVGLAATGLDPSEQLAEMSLRRGLRVQRATLEEFALHSPRAHWDAICIWNTFDQLPHPAPVLRAASRLLVPGGALLLRVPHGEPYRRWALRSHERRSALTIPGLAWNNLLGFPYLNGYSVRSLDRLMSGYGFERREVAGDTLCTLADRDHAAWARTEEAAWKAAQRLRAWASPDTAPWLELRFTAPGAD